MPDEDEFDDKFFDSDDVNTVIQPTARGVIDKKKPALRTRSATVAKSDSEEELLDESPRKVAPPVPKPKPRVKIKQSPSQEKKEENVKKEDASAAGMAIKNSLKNIGNFGPKQLPFMTGLGLVGWIICIF